MGGDAVAILAGGRVLKIGDGLGDGRVLDGAVDDVLLPIVPVV